MEFNSGFKGLTEEEIEVTNDQENVADLNIDFLNPWKDCRRKT